MEQGASGEAAVKKLGAPKEAGKSLWGRYLKDISTPKIQSLEPKFAWMNEEQAAFKEEIEETARNAQNGFWSAACDGGMSKGSLLNCTAYIANANMSSSNSTNATL